MKIQKKCHHSFKSIPDLYSAIQQYTKKVLHKIKKHWKGIIYSKVVKKKI